MARDDFKISYSRINTYLFCPQKYKLVYIDDVHIPINADIAFGQSIHKTLDAFHAKKLNTLEELFECYDASWKNEGFITPQESFLYYQKGKKILETYFETFKKTKPTVVYTEKSFDTNIGKYRFIGIIDRIDKLSDGKYEVTDYKTHKNIWSQQEVDNDLQLSFYAYACKNVFGFNPDKISIYFLSADKKIYTTRSREQINSAIELSLDTAEKIMAEEFTPNTLRCAKCDFKFKCKYSTYKEEESK